MPPTKTTHFDDLFKNVATKYQLDWMMLKAIAANESNVGRYPSVALGMQNPTDWEKSKSQDGKSWGLMQVTLTTARDWDPNATPTLLNNPAYSVDLAARYLQWLYGRFPSIDGRLTEWVVKSYNQGPGNTANERAGKNSGYANEYWDRYQRNYARIQKGEL